MWRRYDGLNYLHPIEISNQLGCSAYIGCSLQQCRNGAQVFTATGFDAYLDDWGGMGDPDLNEARYFSRQITSIKNEVPVMALIDGGLHAVIVVGGNYSTGRNGLKRWDYVYVNDPYLSFVFDDYTAGAWSRRNIMQVISYAATSGWQDDFATFGASAQYRGRRRPSHP